MSGEGAGLVDGAVGVGSEGPAIGLYEAIFRRRDVRAQFTGGVPHVLGRHAIADAGSHLEAVPDLERHGWRERAALSTALHYDGWNESNRTTNREDDHEQR